MFKCVAANSKETDHAYIDVNSFWICEVFKYNAFSLGNIAGNNLKVISLSWVLKLSMYDYNVKYKKNTTNIEVDMLSRCVVHESCKKKINWLISAVN